MQIYNATAFSNAPDWGLKCVNIATPGHAFPDYNWVESHVQAVETGGGALFSVDLESFAPPSADVPGWLTLAAYLNLASNIPWTIYGIGGHSGLGYWPVQTQAEAQRWYRETADMWPVYQRMPVLSPSMYIRTGQDIDRWLTDAHHVHTVIKDTRKTIRPFVMPFYQDFNEQLNQPLPHSWWTTILDTCDELFGGVIVWGGQTLMNPGGWVSMPWDPDACWWLEVQGRLTP